MDFESFQLRVIRKRWKQEMGRGKGVKTAGEKAFAKTATGEIKEGLCSESFPRQAATTL